MNGIRAQAAEKRVEYFVHKKAFGAETTSATKARFTADALAELSVV